MPSLEKKDASKFPEHPINVIVPFSAGGGMDLQARALEKVALKHLGQPLVILNKPGGGGVIGWNELLNADPNGYTLGITGVDLILHSLYKQSKYHYTSALAPIAQIATSPSIMVINADQPWNNLEELVQYAKEHPGELKCGHGGIGSLSHILGESLAAAAHISLEQVPFKGGSETTKALLGNHVQIVFSDPSTLKEQIKAGKLRPIATTGIQRSSDPVFSQIPTFQELGFDIVLDNWRGIAASKNVPPEIQAQLAKKFEDVILDPELKENVEKMGLEFKYLGPEESQKKWIEDAERLAKMLKGTGVIEKVQEQKQ